ncbi:unnamed protein product, partial [Didymodactylos carnosus]
FILSFTKLSKTFKHDVVINIHKAFTLLIENVLLKREEKFLANSSKYFPCYVKCVPRTYHEVLNLINCIAKFGVSDLQCYYPTLKAMNLNLESAYLTKEAGVFFDHECYKKHITTIDIAKFITSAKWVP